MVSTEKSTKSLSLVDKVKLGLVFGAIGISAAAFSYWFNGHSKIYNGPVDIAGVEKVEAKQVHDTCAQFSCLKYVGNQVDVYLSDGNKLVIRDYNGDFEMNEKDSIDGKITGDVNTANQILKETYKKAKVDGTLNSYISIY